MTERARELGEVDRFIQNRIDSVPHLEALLLLWNSRPAEWTPMQLAIRIYIEPNAAHTVLRDLARQELISRSAGEEECYAYVAHGDDKDRLIALVDTAYRREMVRISRMIHAKGPIAIRQFAQAFRFKKKDRK